MPKIQINGIDIYYEQHGWDKDADVLVLSNGVLMGTASWAFQTPALSKHFRVLLYDCRGQWQSDHPREPYSMELHADDLNALLDAFHIERAHLAGISYGAEISMVFALKYPARVQRLVLSSAVSQVDPLLRGIIEMWIESAKLKGPDLFFKMTYLFNFSERWIAANAQALEKSRTRYGLLDFDAVVNLCEAFLQLNITAQLPQIKVPTCVMVGEQDILKPRRYAEIIANQIPCSELVVVPNAGHALCLEQPETFNSVMLGFLKKNSVQ